MEEIINNIINKATSTIIKNIYFNIFIVIIIIILISSIINTYYMHILNKKIENVFSTQINKVANMNTILS